jgi:dipeptide/tripeptide permease
MIARAASVDVDIGTTVDSVASLPVYVEMFSFLAQVAVVLGLLVMLTAPLVKRFMHQP